MNFDDDIPDYTVAQNEDDICTDIIFDFVDDAICHAISNGGNVYALNWDGKSATTIKSAELVFKGDETEEIVSRLKGNESAAKQFHAVLKPWIVKHCADKSPKCKGNSRKDKMDFLMDHEFPGGFLAGTPDYQLDSIIKGVEEGEASIINNQGVYSQVNFLLMQGFDKEIIIEKLP